MGIVAGLRATPKQKRQSSPARPAPRQLIDEAVFTLALADLARLDPPFMDRILASGATPRLRRREAGFAGLAAIVVAQQVSTASATAIFSRLEAHLGQVGAERLQAASDADLKGCGLSMPKLRTLRAVAAAEIAGTLDFAALTAAEAEHAHARLVELHGIGPWTADVFLLFCLGHADAWPVGDLALQEAARLALDLPARPTARDLQAIGERWRPLRGVAAHCLWAYYGAMCGRAAPAPGKTRPAGRDRDRR